MRKLFSRVLFACLLTGTPALADPAGLFCSNDGNSFLIGRPADGSMFDVRLSSWQGLFHCGIEGKASVAPDGWLLEKQGCELQLREEGEAIVLSASPREACAAFCGERASFGGLSFPYSGRVTGKPDSSLFEHDLGELAPC